MAGRRVPHLKKATCQPGHRGRWAVQGECCRDCVPRIPSMVMEDGPTPHACPHCHAEPPIWVVDDFARCVACGARWERRIVAAYL